MRRSDLADLHFITPIANVASILEHGILCHKKAKRLDPASVAMPEIQDIRAKKAVPAGKPLHEDANLYIHARNPMLYKRSDKHLQICVLRVSTDVLDLPDVVIADGNAASDYTAYWPSPSGLAKADKELVFAEYWTDEDQFMKWHKTRVKCAEVLVPGKIDQMFIQGAHVSCKDAAQRLKEEAEHLRVTIDAHLFFRG